MMRINNIYEKKLSHLSDLQTESTLRYGIVETSDESGSIYGIVVTCEKDGKLYSDMVQFISSSKEVVANIVTYLYENAVGESACRSVISDLVPESA